MSASARLAETRIVNFALLGTGGVTAIVTRLVAVCIPVSRDHGGANFARCVVACGVSIAVPAIVRRFKTLSPGAGGECYDKNPADSLHAVPFHPTQHLAPNALGIAMSAPARIADIPHNNRVSDLR